MHEPCASKFITRLPLLFAVLCWASWSTGALAAPPRTTADLLETEEDFIGDIDTVISATRIRQPLTESPSSITIIDRDMIAASGAIEVADVLRQVPGLVVGYPQGNQIAVTYHGLGDAWPRSMQVLIDGRSIYQPSFADIDWMMLGLVLEDIERIEVIRGPNSPLYGSNAVSGVINIITRLPYQDRGTTARITAGDLGTRNGVIRHGGTAGALDYRVTLNYQESDGFDGDLNSTNDNRKLSAASFRGNWHPRPSDEVDIQLGYAGGDLGGGAEPREDPVPHDKQVSSSYQFLSWQRTQEDDADLRIQFYHNTYDSNDRYRDLLSHAYGIPPEFVPALLDGTPDQVANFGLYDYKGERYDMALQYTSPQSGKLRTVAGAGIRLNRLKSQIMANRGDWIDEFSQRAFVNISYRATDQLLLNFGAMAENSNEFGAHLSPRLAINWLFDKQHSMRASYTRSIRNPSLIENNFNNVYKLDDGTPYFIDFASKDPGHETLTSVELGYVGYWLDRRLMLDAKLFYEKIEDRIRFVDDPTIPQPFPAIPFLVDALVNDNFVKIYGGEFQLKYQAGPRDFLSLQFSTLDTDIVWRDQINPDVFDNPKENVVPRYITSALLSKSLPHGFEVSAAYYHISKMVWLGDGDRIPGYDRVDLRAAKRWRTAGSNMMLEAIVQNVGDDYLTFRDENFFETRAYLRFSLDFN
ncbi:MAG: TonB-dependent receptor [Gammaproteobacteria bacterium]|nr:TonB-dependent receptor [Gammaproteobacteria bacterium]